MPATSAQSGHSQSMGRGQGSATLVRSAVRSTGQRLSSDRAVIAQPPLASKFHHDLLKLQQADPYNGQRLETMLASNMPAAWAWDTAFADAHADQPEGTEALSQAAGEYLQLRLRHSGQRLVASDWLDRQELIDMQRSVVPTPLAWTAVRTLDILAENDRLQQVRTTAGPERQAAIDWQLAYNQQAITVDWGSEDSVCVYPATALALSHGLSRSVAADAIYSSGAIEQHRQLLIERGIVTDAPVVVTDFANVSAVRGMSELDTVGNSAGGEQRHIWIDGQTMADELAANNGYSPTLYHELLHTVQDERMYIDDETAIGQAALRDSVVEGVTEAVTRLDLAEHISPEAYAEQFQWNNNYLTDMALVTAIANRVDHEQPERYLRQLATSADRIMLESIDRDLAKINPHMSEERLQNLVLTAPDEIQPEWSLAERVEYFDRLLGL